MNRILGVLPKLKSHPFLNTFILSIILILAILNWFYPALRFTSGLLDALFMLFVFLVTPILLIINGIFFNNSIVKITYLVIFGLISPIFLGLCFITGVYIFFMLGDGFNASFERINKLDMPYYNISVYRTNGGAMTSFGIIVRQEKMIFPGVLLVKNIHSIYHRSEWNCRMLNKNTILMDVNEDGYYEEYKLKRFVYF